jgi:hypothetical protein
MSIEDEVNRARNNNRSTANEVAQRQSDEVDALARLATAFGGELIEGEALLKKNGVRSWPIFVAGTYGNSFVFTRTWGYLLGDRHILSQGQLLLGRLEWYKPRTKGYLDTFSKPYMRISVSDRSAARLQAEETFAFEFGRVTVANRELRLGPDGELHIVTSSQIEYPPETTEKAHDYLVKALTRTLESS